MLAVHRTFTWNVLASWERGSGDAAAEAVKATTEGLLNGLQFITVIPDVGALIHCYDTPWFLWWNSFCAEPVSSTTNDIDMLQRMMEYGSTMDHLHLFGAQTTSVMRIIDAAFAAAGYRDSAHGGEPTVSTAMYSASDTTACTTVRVQQYEALLYGFDFGRHNHRNRARDLLDFLLALPALNKDLPLKNNVVI
jgi:hypothetical protein